MLTFKTINHGVLQNNLLIGELVAKDYRYFATVFRKKQIDFCLPKAIEQSKKLADKKKGKY